MVTFPFFFLTEKVLKATKSSFFFFLEDFKKPGVVVRSWDWPGAGEKDKKNHKKSTFSTFFPFSSFLFPSSLPSWQPGFGKAELRTQQDNKPQTQRVFLGFIFVPLHLYKVVKCLFFFFSACK